MQRLQREYVGLSLLAGDNFANKGGKLPGSAWGDFPAHAGTVLEALHKGFAIPHTFFPVNAVGDAASLVEEGHYAIVIAGGISGYQLWPGGLCVIDNPHRVAVVIGGAPA